MLLSLLFPRALVRGCVSAAVAPSAAFITSPAKGECVNASFREAKAFQECSHKTLVPCLAPRKRPREDSVEVGQSITDVCATASQALSAVKDDLPLQNACICW